VECAFRKESSIFVGHKNLVAINFSRKAPKGFIVNPANLPIIGA
jgi:hypothetical protein